MIANELKASFHAYYMCVYAELTAAYNRDSLAYRLTQLKVDYSISLALAAVLAIKYVFFDGNLLDSGESLPTPTEADDTDETDSTPTEESEEGMRVLPEQGNIWWSRVLPCLCSHE